MSDPICNYLSTAYFHPAYIPGYYPIWYLFKDSTYSEIDKFFSTLEIKDKKRKEFRDYKKAKLIAFMNGITNAKVLEKLTIDQRRKLANEIFNTSIKIDYMLPKYAFSSFNKSMFNSLFILKNYNLLDNLINQKKGVVLISHHWCAFQFSMIYFLVNNLPITFLISDEVVHNLTDIYDFSKYPNAEVIGLSSQKGKKSDYALYKSIKELKQGRIIFILCDNPVTPKNITKKTTFMGSSVYISRGGVGLAKIAKVPILHLVSYINSKTEKTTLEFGELITFKKILNNKTEDLVSVSNKYMEKELLKRLDHWIYADWFYKYMLVKDKNEK